MVETLIAFLLPVLLFGVNTTFSNGVGIVRYVAEHSSGRHRRTKRDRVANRDHLPCEANSAASRWPESPATFGGGVGTLACGQSPTTPSAAQHRRDTADSTGVGTWHRYRPDDPERGEWDLVILIHPDGRSYNGSPILDTTYRRFSR